MDRTGFFQQVTLEPWLGGCDRVSEELEREKEKGVGCMKSVKNEAGAVFFWNWKQSDLPEAISWRKQYLEVTYGVEAVGGLDVFPFHLFFFMCIVCACWALCAHRGQKRCGIPCNWSYRLVVKCLMRVLRTEPGSLREHWGSEPLRPEVLIFILITVCGSLSLVEGERESH